MRKPTTYQQTLDRLKTVGTRELAVFERAVASLKDRDDYASTVTDARAALDTLVLDPDLFSSRRASCGGGGAPLLMAAVGFKPLINDRYEYVGERTPVALRRLALASAALESFAREEPGRRAAARFADLPPEPPVGAAGTTTLTLLPCRDRRRFAADDPFAKAMPWVRAAAAAPAAAPEDVELVHPTSSEPVDERKTLQALGLWPSATLRLRGTAPPPPPPRAASKVKKPKPSDLFKQVKAARKAAERRDATDRRDLLTSRFDARPRAAPAPA
mmetsp:Transcript_16089/g.48322  ORF Transcript_16089/g.48322 Transcript_16089/m.48322 type:complete len:273 (+) Transcript_16089:237-1055(+)